MMGGVRQLVEACGRPLCRLAVLLYDSGLSLDHKGQPSLPALDSCFFECDIADPTITRIRYWLLVAGRVMCGIWLSLVWDVVLWVEPRS